MMQLLPQFIKKTMLVSRTNLRCLTVLFNSENSTSHLICNLKRSVHTTNYKWEKQESKTKTDKELDAKRRLVLSEHAILYEEGHRVPSTLNEEQIDELMLCYTSRQREKFMLFIGHNNYKRQLEKQKKQEKTVTVSDKPINTNKFFIRILKNTMNNYQRTNELNSFNFNQPLIFDFDFEDKMSTHEIRALVKQLVEIRHVNRVSPEPFPIYFQNYNKNSFLHKRLCKQLNTETLPIVLSSEDYIDKFPKEKLCYLSPHAPTIMNKYDHDKIYIIGAIVDKSGQGPLSFAKARQQGIQMTKLPLDRYLKWKTGSKYLNLVSMTKILHDFKLTDDWDFAFRHISKRLLEIPNKYDRVLDDKTLRKWKLPRNYQIT